MQDLLKKHLFVNILCGGGGTRLWPASRRKTPKQFVNLFGKKTLFQMCLEHSSWLTSPDKILITTNADYIDEVLQQGKAILPRNVIAEPQAKNTAMPMGIAAVYIKKEDPQAVIINFPSDHLISDKKEFVDNILLAAEAAASGDYITTLGIKPTFPHTGLGYIEVKKDFVKFSSGRVFEVARFREKPDLATAKKFLKTGRFYWNAGIFVWQPETILSAFEKYAPKTANLLKEVEKAIGEENEREVFEEVFEKAENISIDYAIAEKAKNLCLVPSSFYWNDVGDWKVIYDLSAKDKEKNVFASYDEKGEFIAVESQNCLIQTGKRFIGAVGVENLIIIDTPDALLVCNKDKAEDVKKLVNLLKEKGKDKYL